MTKFSSVSWELGGKCLYIFCRLCNAIYFHCLIGRAGDIRRPKFSVKPEYVLVGLSGPALAVPTFSYEELGEGRISCSGDPSRCPWTRRRSGKTWVSRQPLVRRPLSLLKAAGLVSGLTQRWIWAGWSKGIESLSLRTVCCSHRNSQSSQGRGQGRESSPVQRLLPFRRNSEAARIFFLCWAGFRSSCLSTKAHLGGQLPHLRAMNLIQTRFIDPVLLKPPQ